MARPKSAHHITSHHIALHCMALTDQRPTEVQFSQSPCVYTQMYEHSFVKEGRVQAHGNCNRQLHSLSPCADCSRSDSIQFVLFRSNSLSFDPIRVVSLRSHSIGRASEVRSFVHSFIRSLIRLHRHVGGRCLAAACMLLQSLLVHIRKY